MSRIKNWFETYATAAAARKTRNEKLGHVLAKVVMVKGKKEVEMYYLGKESELKKFSKKYKSVKVY